MFSLSVLSGGCQSGVDKGCYVKALGPLEFAMIKSIALSSKLITNNSFDSDGTSVLVVGGSHKIALTIETMKPVKGAMTSQIAERFGAKVPETKESHVLHLNAYSCSNLNKAVEAMKELRAFEGGEDAYIVMPERLQYATQLTLERLGFQGSKITQEVVEECLLTRPSICKFEQEVKTLAGYFA